MSLIDIFLKHYPPDENGITEIAWIEDLVQIDPNFQTNNGCQWARKGSRLDKKYIIKRFNAKEMEITGVTWNRVVAIQLQGFKSISENHSIPTSIKNALKGQPCVVLGVISSDMEIDHKNGKYNSKEYTINDFQPMTKAVNDAKREHCKKCNANGKRFDAQSLGYPVSYIKGDKNSTFCEGCFWYDPKAFRQTLTMKGI